MSATNRAFWSGERSRKIVKRIVVEGNLTLVTPAHLGNGEVDEVTDMPLFVDRAGDELLPVLTGSNIAGALRNYVHTRCNGFYKSENDAENAIASQLFGQVQASDDGSQSCLIVDDALGKPAPSEFRTGVGLDCVSRTAVENRLYDFELWEAGTVFSLRFELVILKSHSADVEQQLRTGLALAMEGLLNGDIAIGARKSRGFGECEVDRWSVRSYDMTIPDGLLGWLKEGAFASDQIASEAHIETVDRTVPAAKRMFLGVTANALPDKREFFEIKAPLHLVDSLLIGSTEASVADRDVDKRHIRSRRKDSQGDFRAIVPGTSLAGALRARADRIVQTLGLPGGQQLVENLFGSEPDVVKHDSRLVVYEREIENVGPDLVQHRVSIDRFTGGALDGALFNERPVFSDDKTSIQVRLRLKDHSQATAGLLLLLFKDLVTEDLPVGGEVAIGRGRMELVQGRPVTFEERTGEQTSRWSFARDQDRLVAMPLPGLRQLADLEEKVESLRAWTGESSD